MEEEEEDNDENDHNLESTILGFLNQPPKPMKRSPLNIEEEYGMFVWPCSIVLLGAGTSLPGLVATKVTLTDDSSRVEIMGITWGEWDLPISNLQPSIILGADILYDSKDFDNLFTTVTFLLQYTPGSVFITTYHNR
ncbi:hypothetical protein MKW94_004424, partial [Papaver nudicaule]|nr:hypothetical protein [Papaver nudicaule]